MTEKRVFSFRTFYNDAYTNNILQLEVQDYEAAYLTYDEKFYSQSEAVQSAVDTRELIAKSLLEVEKVMKLPVIQQKQLHRCLQI